MVSSLFRTTSDSFVSLEYLSVRRRLLANWEDLKKINTWSGSSCCHLKRVSTFKTAFKQKFSPTCWNPLPIKNFQIHTFYPGEEILITDRQWTRQLSCESLVKKRLFLKTNIHFASRFNSSTRLLFFEWKKLVKTQGTKRRILKKSFPRKFI